MRRGVEEITLPPGERVCREGEKTSEMYILLSGTVGVWREGVELAKISGEGAIFGEVAALIGTPRSATIVTVTETRLLKVGRVISDVKRRIPDLPKRLHVTLTERFELTRNKAALYEEIVSEGRRYLLQETIWRYRNRTIRREGEGARRRERQKARLRIDSRLEDVSDPNDPKLLEEIASEYGVLDEYLDVIRERYGPVIDLHRRFREAENQALLAGDEVTMESCELLASALSEITEILAIYERSPGRKVEMDIYQMEKIVPFSYRAEALRDVFHDSLPFDLTEPQRRNAADKVRRSIEEAKTDAGRDLPRLDPVAERFGLADEYRERLHQAFAMAETGAAYTDLTPYA